MKIMIDGRYEIPLVDGLLDNQEKADHVPYSQRLLERPRDVGGSAWCMEQLLRVVGKLGNAVEYFAGLGMGSTILHQLHPELVVHYMYDIDPSMVRQLRSLGFGVGIQADSYDIRMRPDCDLVVLDFHRYTILQWSREPAKKRLLEEVFALKPDYVILTDTAIYRVRLDPTPYDPVLKIHTEPNIYSYMNACLDCYANKYDYIITHVAYHRMASYVLLQPWEGGAVPDIAFMEAPKETNKWVKLETP